MEVVGGQLGASEMTLAELEQGMPLIARLLQVALLLIDGEDSLRKQMTNLIGEKRWRVFMHYLN